MSKRSLAVLIAVVLLSSTALAGAEVKLTALTLQGGKTVQSRIRQDLPDPFEGGHAGNAHFRQRTGFGQPEVREDGTGRPLRRGHLGLRALGRHARRLDGKPRRSRRRQEELFGHGPGLYRQEDLRADGHGGAVRHRHPADGARRLRLGREPGDEYRQHAFHLQGFRDGLQGRPGLDLQRPVQRQNPRGRQAGHEGPRDRREDRRRRGQSEGPLAGPGRVRQSPGFDARQEGHGRPGPGRRAAGRPGHQRHRQVQGGKGRRRSRGQAAGGEGGPRIAGDHGRRGVGPHRPGAQGGPGPARGPGRARPGPWPSRRRSWRPRRTSSPPSGISWPPRRTL
ncbi:MAG: hypothetical protein M0C28_21075 [Candidatus Moduliflexus flocculans]|nr:hypothetical protein [Candidatus Moduliflexus flocculans]